MHAKSALEFMTDNTANEQDQNAGNSRVAEYLSTKKNDFAALPDMQDMTSC